MSMYTCFRVFAFLRYALTHASVGVGPCYLMQFIVAGHTCMLADNFAGPRIIQSHSSTPSYSRSCASHAVLIVLTIREGNHTLLVGRCRKPL